MERKLYIVRKEFDGFGGAENVAKRFLEGFQGTFNASLIYAGCNEKDYKFLGRKGPGWFRSLSFASSVNKFLSQKPDALAFSMTRGIPGAIFRMGDGVHKCWLRRKKTGIVKKITNPNHLITPILERYSINKSKYVVPNSQLIFKELEQYYPEYKHKCEVIKNGYKQAFFQFAKLPERKTLKTEHNLSHDCLNILFCANGWERKGLIYAFKMLSVLTKITPCHLWVVGRGNHSEFAQKAKGLGIAKDISFIGPVAYTASWYKMVDLFVLPTLYDPFSNSCLEALACGCPVLTTESNGVSECLNESNGLAVKNPQDVVQGNVIKWIKEIRNLNRKLISESVKELTSENEINSYLQLLNA